MSTSNNENSGTRETQNTHNDTDDLVFVEESNALACDQASITTSAVADDNGSLNDSLNQNLDDTLDSTNNENGFEDFGNFSSDEISDCGNDDDDDELYKDEPTSPSDETPDEEEYDEYCLSEEGTEDYDKLDSDDEEFVIGSRRSNKRSAAKPKSSTRAKKSTSTKRSISSAFGKSRRPSIKFKKKKKSSAYGEIDYGDTTTEEELSSEEEYNEDDYFYKYESCGSDENNASSTYGTTSATSKKFDINQFGTESKYNDASYRTSTKLLIDKVLNYKFGPTSLIGKKIHSVRVLSEREEDDDQNCKPSVNSSFVADPNTTIKIEPIKDDKMLHEDSEHCRTEPITGNEGNVPCSSENYQLNEIHDCYAVEPTTITNKNPKANLLGLDSENENDHHYVMQFLIKWKDKSYLHCSWESEKSITELGVTNTKKLQNFCQDNNIDPSCTVDPVSLMDEYSQSMFSDKNQAIDDVMGEFTKLDSILAISPSSVLLEQYSVYESTSEINLDELLCEGVHFLCLWNNLPYCDATWEDASFIHELFPNAIREFFVSKSKMYYQLDLRRMGNLRFYKVAATPDFIAHCKCDDSTKLEDVKMDVETSQPVQNNTQPIHSTCNILRDYQLEGINWLTSSFCRKKSVILADEMGLGKTVQVISFISTLHHTYQINGPYLIVVPLSTVESWKTHFQKWAPELNVIGYTGNADSRKAMRKYSMFDNDGEDNPDFLEKIRTDHNTNSTTTVVTATTESQTSHEFNIYNFQLKFHVLVTTYEMIIKDKEFIGQFDWVSLVVDEAHRLKNVESSLYTTLQTFYSSHRLLMTGTPLQNNLRELWSILHFILPDRYPSWDDFEMNFSQVDPKSGYMKLQKEISPYILRRMKKDVEKSLPPKIEQILRVEMTKKQKDLYKCILTKNYTQLSKELKCNITGFLNVMMELKKCCNHTSLITHLDLADCTLQDILRGGGKLILLDKLLERFKRDGSRVLIFSQMIMILDILSAYLTLKGYSFQRLDGSIGEAKRKQAMNEFNAVGSENFCFLLSTRAGGLGINLVSADVVIIFDSDWNPQNDLQAQARAHRIGQTKTVKIYRLVTKGSVDETIVERAKKKMVLDHLVIQTMSGVGGNFVGGNSKSNSMASSLDKKDLSSIIKFGAEELFKEGDEDNDDKLEEMDIDQILLFAEEHDSDQLNSNTSPNNVGEELLCSFKVANFKTSDFDMEDDENGDGENNQSESEIDLNWDDIIPERERRRILDEEETARMAQLYLPPRRRSNVPLIDPLSALTSKVKSSAKPSTKNAKKGSRHNTKYSKNDGSDADDIYVESSDDKPSSTTNSRKKRKLSQFFNDFNGLTGQDVKKFVASYKKFPSAWERCEVVARDASLSNKPIKQVQQLARWLHSILPKANPKSSSKSKQPRSNKLTINAVQFSSSDLYEWEQLTKPIAQHIKSHIVDKSQEFSNVKVANTTLEFFRELYPSLGDCFRYCKFPKFSFHKKVNWKSKYDAELIVGVFFKGFSNWKDMFDANLLTSIKDCDMSSSALSKKMKSRLCELMDVIGKTKFSTHVSNKDSSDLEVEETDSIKSLSEDDDDFEDVKKEIKPEKASSLSKKKDLNRKKSAPKESGDHQKSPKSSKSKKSTSNHKDNEKSSSKCIVSGSKSSKKPPSSNLITQYMKSSKDVSPKEVPVVNNPSSLEKEKITEISLTDKMINGCCSLLKPVKSSISTLESIFKGRILDDVTNLSEFMESLDAVGRCIDLSHDKYVSSTKKSKIFKNVHHMKCAMWNFVSRFTNATPLELYNFYFESKSNA